MAPEPARAEGSGERGVGVKRIVDALPSATKAAEAWHQDFDTANALVLRAGDEIILSYSPAPAWRCHVHFPLDAARQIAESIITRAGESIMDVKGSS